MRNFIPQLNWRKPGEASGLWPKFGGLPWGLPQRLWPHCGECGLAMSFVTQLPVREGLDHAAMFRDRPKFADQVLHVFKCERESICDFWDPEGGANAAFFVSENVLADGPTELPELSVPVLPELWVKGWTVHVDDVPEELAINYVDDAAFYKLPEALQFPHEFEGSLMNKLGGAPYWTGNGPMSPPTAPFQYLLQIDQFQTPEDGEEVVFGNFCSDGVGYLFVNPDDAALPCLFQINR